MKLYTADREAGNLIDEIENINEGINLIKEYEKIDLEEGTFTPDFYDIVNEDHESMLYHPEAYKYFEKVLLGSSDVAEVILRNSEKLERLHFGGDGSYEAYFINEVIKLPAHYTKEAEFKKWLWIYDDSELTVKIEASKIEIYRAGEMGCLIYAPDGTVSGVTF